MLAVKRLLDILLSAVGLILSLPLLLIIALLVRLKLGTPVIFAQQRPGLNGKPFTLYKFRSMTNATDSAGNLLPSAERLTPFGRMLRSTSLDELPELYNILRGEMSFVGPRPLLMHYLPRYTPEQARRHLLRPGLTGWAQVNGRNAITWEERLALDTWYVDNWSCWLDVKILYRTIFAVLHRKGINQSESVSMPEFLGAQGPDKQ